MNRFRIHPQAVCRHLLGRLNKVKPLSASEQKRVLSALKSTGIPSVTDRLIAGMGINTVQEILKKI